MKAQQHAPAQLAAEAGLRAAEANLSTANSRPNPTLTYENENVLGSGRYAGFGGGERTLSLSVPIELGGKRKARRTVAEADRAVAGLGIAVTRADITQRATEAFVEAVAAERRLAVVQEANELAGRAAHAARERVRVGKASPIEEQRADVVRVRAEVTLTKAVRGLALARANLARLTGSSSDVSTVAGWFDVMEPPRVQRTDATPSVLAAEAQVAAAGARVAAARSDRIPDLTVTAGVRRYGDVSDKAAVLGISVPLPLFNTGTAALARSRAEYDRALAERDVAAQEAARAQAQAEAEVADALSMARAATGPALAAAREAARIARIGYAEGKFPQLELLDAERALAETQEAAVDALAAFYLAQARLGRLYGSTNPIYKD